MFLDSKPHRVVIMVSCLLLNPQGFVRVCSHIC